MQEGLTFDDVLLVPRRSVLSSRKDADISAEVVKGKKIQIPIISANMPAITGAEMAIAMHQSGGFGVLHRFSTTEEAISEAMTAQSEIGTNNFGISIGLEKNNDRLDALLRYTRYAFFDVAHADSDRCYDYIINLLRRYEDDISLVVGNVATASAAGRYAMLGVAGIKVGIGPGAACTTRQVTGFGVPQLTAIMRTYRALVNAPEVRLIADGGIKNSGDMVKALAAGADTVMVGRLLAGTNETPTPGVYYGSASKHVNGHNAPEGEYGEVAKKGPVADVLKNLSWGIRSGVSYGGAKNLKGLRINADFMRVSNGTALENSTRF